MVAATKAQIFNDVYTGGTFLGTFGVHICATTMTLTLLFFLFDLLILGFRTFLHL